MTIEDEGRRHGQGHTRRGRRRVCRRTQEVNYRPDSDLYRSFNRRVSGGLPPRKLRISCECETLILVHSWCTLECK
jgi:hypothetical protein